MSSNVDNVLTVKQDNSFTFSEQILYACAFVYAIQSQSNLPSTVIHEVS